MTAFSKHDFISDFWIYNTWLQFKRISELASHNIISRKI